jgi:hypothetical protein
VRFARITLHPPAHSIKKLGPITINAVYLLERDPPPDDDPLCWTIDDQFYCGEDLLVAPLFNAEGRRDVYLPAGRWRPSRSRWNTRRPRPAPPAA